MINKIGKITLYVNDQQAARQFWIDKMGFVVKNEQPMGPNIMWLEVGPSEDAFTTFVLYEKELMKKQNPKMNVEHPSILLSTKNIKAAYEKMLSNGVDADKIIEMPYGNMFTFKDQDGNPYILREDL